MPEEIIPEESISDGKDCTIKQLIKENKTLKETNQMLSDMVDTYDRELKSMTKMLEKQTNSLKKATEIIENTNRPEGAVYEGE